MTDEQDNSALGAMEGEIPRTDQELQMSDMKPRDYFAVMALQGLLSCGAASAAIELAQDTDELGEMILAKRAYAYADAMLKARK